MDIILVGYGKMGKLIAETISLSEGMALLGIVENFVSFGSFLEFLFRLFVARVAVWMILDGYLSISLLYFVF